MFFLVFLLFAGGSIYAHKDRIERPKSFKFILRNNKVVNFNSADSKLEKFCDEIVYGKKKILEAQLIYDTGEIVTFKSNGKNWISIKIFSKNKAISVPKQTLNKISEIHFSTVNLLWSGESDAFNSSYCYIQFDIGSKMVFGEFPYLQLSFENQKFSKATVWKQISEDSKQGKDL